jgi:hypothetical protein
MPKLKNRAKKRDARHAKLTKALNIFTAIGLFAAGQHLLLVFASHSWGIFGTGFYLWVAFWGFLGIACLIPAFFIFIKRWTGYNYGWVRLVIPLIYAILVWLCFHYGWIYLQASWSFPNYG